MCASRVRCAGRRVSDGIRTVTLPSHVLAHFSRAIQLAIHLLKHTPHDRIKNRHTSKMPPSSRLPPSELELSCRIPAQGELSSLPCPLSPLLPPFGRAAAPISGGLSPFSFAGILGMTG